MPRYIALLRGINVGGNRIIRMEDLRKTVTKAGATDVATYIQSGNVVLTHADRSATKVAGVLAAAIAKASGFDVPVVLRTAGEWGRVISETPYPKADDDHVHVFFLGAVPAADALAKLDAKAFEPERFALVGRDLYVHLPNGMGKSKLAVAVMKLKSMAGATARNWRTVRQLQAMATPTTTK